MIKLVLKFNGAIVRELNIEKQDVFVGRKSDNDLVIDNPAVSGKHCRVYRQGESYFAEDLKSTNGTFLRDRRISTEPLHHRDELAIAKHTVEFYNDEETPSTVEKSAVPLSSDATVVMTSPPAAGRCVARGPYADLWPEPKPTPFALTQLTTYIGKSDQALIKLKGLFAPDLAACVAKKSDGYYLTALSKIKPSG
jgi:pSer/pThr/pTyr-binding forkhead associated (FHA) protein